MFTALGLVNLVHNLPFSFSKTNHALVLYLRCSFPSISLSVIPTILCTHFLSLPRVLHASSIHYYFLTIASLLFSNIISLRSLLTLRTQLRQLQIFCLYPTSYGDFLPRVQRYASMEIVLLTNAFIYLFIYLFIYSFIHSFII
jgi:hypothetical protein